ncbi:MAG: RNA pseudouridine synthase [Anaerolineae bacterium]|nr:RNA pseudouridine synthase [Anaerolineae bacterium]MDW8099273.1 RNA pseudouridine synthase [Anaerolineae bacterium]
MLSTLFVNEDVIAVNKPEGLASIPEPRVKDCLLSLLSAAFPEKLYVVHRLDKEASGVILLARNARAHRFLSEQFSSRSVQKTYVALTHGIIAASTGIIDKPLREFGSGRMGVDFQRGKPSLTEFRVLERLAAYTLVELHPRTGRRHQLRAHCYSIGHPIVGDLRYGDRALQRQFPRLMLHSWKITFILSSGEEVTVKAPIPQSFQAVIEAARKG